MGVDYTTYVEPYIQVHNPPVPSTEEYHTCPTKSCKNHKRAMTDKFCPLCGEAIKLSAFPCQAPKEFNFYDEFNGSLSEVMTEYKPNAFKHHVFLISNKKGTPGESFDPVESILVKELSHVDSATEIAQFTHIFQKEIKILLSVFGADAVKIKWGVLNWAW